MATKKTTTAAEVIANASTTEYELRNYFQQYSNVSLRRLADATGISYAWILKSSKKPIVGESYDPSTINYSAIAEVLSRKDIHLQDLPWNEMNTANPRNSVAKLSKDPADFPNGSKWYLRGSNDKFEIVYQTATNVIIIAQDSTVPQNLNWQTFFQKGPSADPRPKVIRITKEDDLIEMLTEEKEA